MPKGYNGKILRVDLTDGKIDVEERDETFYRTYYGGRGFNAYTLMKEVPKGADPLGPENKLLFSLGPITGAPLSGSGRNSVGAKSPLTGGSALPVELAGDAATLQDALAALDRQSGRPISHSLLHDERTLLPSIAVLVNGSNVLLGAGLQTRLADGDQVAVMPLISGG